MDKHHRKYNTNTGVENFILRLKNNNPTLEYYADYIDSESKVKLKCTVCGNIFERWASCVRTPGKIRCYECEKIATQKRRELEKLIKRDNNICYLCGKECNSNDYTYKGNVFIAGNYYPSVDHIKPIAKGGKHSWDNVKLAHRICNSIKSDKY